MKRMFIVLLMLSVMSCGTNYSTPDNVKWSIRKEVSNRALGKCNIEVQLEQKVEENVLKDIALEIRQDHQEYNKLWILYFIPEMADSMAWATTNFTPKLEIEILGSTAKQDSVLTQNDNINGVIINSWKSEQSLMGGIMILYKDSTGKLMMRTKFTDGSAMDRKIKETKFNRQVKYQDNNTHGEYFILESNGNLGMYGENGKYDEADQILK